LTLRWLRLTDDELLLRLKSLFEKEGRLSEQIINSTLGVPSIDVYCERFGSLRNAYRRIGYELKWDLDWIDRRSEFNELLRDTAADLAARLQKAGSVASFEPGIDVLTVNNRFAISLRLARSWRGSGREPIWTINRRAILPCFADQASAADQTIEIKPVQKNERPRAALIERRYRKAPMNLP